jgi:hypothetical protein
VLWKERAEGLGTASIRRREYILKDGRSDGEIPRRYAQGWAGIGPESRAVESGQAVGRSAVWGPPTLVCREAPKLLTLLGPAGSNHDHPPPSLLRWRTKVPRRSPAPGSATGSESQARLRLILSSPLMHAFASIRTHDRRAGVERHSAPL